MKFPHIIKDFATDKELNILYEFSSTTDLWCFSGDERWDGRNCYLTELIDQVGVESPALKTMVEVWSRCEDLIREEVSMDIQLECPQFTRWFPGDDIWPSHADNCHPDGKPNYSPHRSHGMVMYLNDDFEGGELVYPDFELTVKPEKGMMCIHTAGWENNHGVRPVENGFRHTTVSFGTMDADFIVENQGSMLNVYR